MELRSEGRKVSARTRFEIFKRDGFSCVYCGTTPLQKPLHVDHVVPWAEGGTGKASNLVTACADCNLGKADVPLARKRFAPPIATQADKDHAQQILEYLEIQREVDAVKTKATNIVADRWEEVVGALSQEMYTHLPSILSRWTLARVNEAMRITGLKMGTVGQKFSTYSATNQAKYFHGVLRRWREAGEAEDPEEGEESACRQKRL